MQDRNLPYPFLRGQPLKVCVSVTGVCVGVCVGAERGGGGGGGE